MSSSGGPRPSSRTSSETSCRSEPLTKCFTQRVTRRGRRNICLMTEATTNRIRYLSPPAAVSMSDDYYGLASMHHFWVRRRFEVLCRLAGQDVSRSASIADVGCGHGILQRQIEEAFRKHVTGFDLNEHALKQTVSRSSPICCYNMLEKN